jgi:hypothetical protein
VGEETYRIGGRGRRPTQRAVFPIAVWHPTHCPSCYKLDPNGGSCCLHLLLVCTTPAFLFVRVDIIQHLVHGEVGNVYRLYQSNCFIRPTLCVCEVVVAVGEGKGVWLVSMLSSLTLVIHLSTPASVIAGEPS